MKDVLEKNLARFVELERQMVDPAVLANGALLAAVAREHGSLARVATKYRRFKELNQQIAQSLELAQHGDAEMRELAEAEVGELRQQREALWNELLEMTIGGEDANRSRCVFEIRAGTGGDEAALFAGDLYEMYKRFAEKHGWDVEILDANPTELGGFKEIVLGIEGDGCFRLLQYESGTHRVQRVPETEAKGRVHTSTATVAVLPEPEDIEIDLKPSDYRKETMRASGPGGQHVNKTSSAIRLTHFESGIVVSCQDEKSQHKNLAKALRVLKTRLYEHKRAQEAKKRADTRRTLVGSGDRSEKIRTYNFPENRITDHRINLSLYQLSNVLAGDLESVTGALVEFDRQELRQAFGTQE